MKSPTCVSNICVTSRKQTASFNIAGLMLAIAPLCLLLVTSNSSAQTSTASSPGDWTQFLRDNMQRWNPNETVLGVNNVGTLQLKWKNPVGASFAGGSESSPAMANGVVYFGSDDFNVYALNASTGAKLWSFTTGDQVVSSPAVANGVVYIGSEDHNLYALNAGTGAKLWSFATGDLVVSSPTVVNGVVYFGSEDGTAYALNASTGTLLWSYGTGSVSFSSPAVANGVVYIGAFDGVFALNATTGAKLWNSSAFVVSSPVVANGVVYVGSVYNNLYALNASTGRVLWSYDTGGEVFSSPAVANGVVYIGSGDSNLYALNASTGTLLWSFTTGGITYSSPAVANGVVYIGSIDDNLYALNATTGAKLWSYDTGNFVISSPAVANGAVYVRSGGFSGGGNVYAFSVGADLFLRIQPTPTTAQGDLLTYAFPVWNLGPANADQEVLTTQVPEGTTFDSIRISGTPGLGTCTTPPYGGTGPIVCHEDSAMAPNTTWTVRLTVKVTALYGTVISESATATEDTPDPNLANNTATVSTTVQLGSADLYLQVLPSPTSVRRGGFITFTFPVWNLGPGDAVHEVLTTQTPYGTTFRSISISGTPGLGTCTTPPPLGTGQIVCYENGSMAPNTTWTISLLVEVPVGPGIITPGIFTETGTVTEDTFDPNLANNTATGYVTLIRTP